MNSNRSRLCLFLGLALGSAAQAACEAPSKTVFSCRTAAGKVIQLCDAGKTVDYSYGLAGRKPEILVRAMRSTASTSQWQGVGRWISYAVDVPNGDTTYSVFWGADRLSDEHPVEAGVNVESRGELLATVRCAGARGLVQNMEGIDLPPTPVK